jgi:hypothetical protein
MVTPINEIIRLTKSREELYVHAGIEIDKGNFWFATTIEKPIKFVLLKVRVINGETQAYKYEGEDREEIIKEFDIKKLFDSSIEEHPTQSNIRLWK